MFIKSCFLLVLLAFFQGARTEENDVLPLVYSSGEINEYTDKILALVRPAMVQNGFDPFHLQDISQDFWFKFVLVNYTGHIDLKNGWIQDLSTIYRLEDSTLKYEKKNLTLNVKLLVDHLVANFDYVAKIFDIGPSGRLTTTIKKQQIHFGLQIDFETITFHLQELSLAKNDQINIKMTGLGLADPIVNIIISALTAVFKNAILETISSQIRNAAAAIIEILPPLLPPLPPSNKETHLLEIFFKNIDLTRD